MFTFGIITVAVFAVVIIVFSYKIWEETRGGAYCPPTGDDILIIVFIFAVLGVGLTSGILAIVHAVSHFAA